ncbi:MAG: hypothetical protein QM765_36825 [Myxococcales bacterium]
MDVGARLDAALAAEDAATSAGLDASSAQADAAAAPHCGDGNKDPGEACDDHNNDSGDGCNATCSSTEICGNGIADKGEECDGEDFCDEHCRDIRIPLPDADDDTIADEHEGRDTLRDSDDDGTPDCLDPDSDNDGIADSVEVGDQSTHTPPADTDGDGTADYLDSDSDDDGVSDAIESAAGTNPRLADSDGDGILDADDGMTDSDEDGTLNALDTDSDNDGISDAMEAGDPDPHTAPRDTDGDRTSLVCNDLRLREPVNYLRANWIRPEDLNLYEEMGFHNFKIVERNTPTAILLERVKAYANRRYDGNLLDLVQNYSYPVEKVGKKGEDALSTRRMLKYFVKPQSVNLLKFTKVIDFGQTASVLFPRRGPNPVQIDNRALDGFMERFKKMGCQAMDCEKCQYCHRWAEKTVKIDPQWKARMTEIYADLLKDIDGGSFWDPYHKTLEEAPDAARRFVGMMRQ